MNLFKHFYCFMPLVYLPLASCSSLKSPLLPGAMLKDYGLIGAGEGPAWKDGSLYFTDGSHINRMDANGKTTVFRSNASNGLLFDREGRLVACESGLRRVTRTEKDGRIIVLADRFEGKRFNTPNDLCMDSKGQIYFTDPRYGPRESMELSFEGVYRINSAGSVTRLDCEGAERPNGILISPDDQYLYIADNNNNTHGGSRKLLRYALDKKGDVKPGSRKVIFDWKNGRGPDGMKMDSAGRIYVAAGTNKVTEWEANHFKAGCYILSPNGHLIDFIPTAPDEACNCALGGADKRTLFITSGNHLWSVRLEQ
jgi:gluconolactonase